jgi:putative oxidoreductase
MLLTFNNTFLLRVGVAVILFMHSIPGMFDGGVNAFGKYYLNAEGFAPVGVPLAWAIKISHVVAACCLLFNRFIILACAITLIILIAGIIMVHFREGWYVVGGGRNGVEFNFLLIAVLCSLILFERATKKVRKDRQIVNS